MVDYASPPIWLNAHVQDSRIAVGDYTYFDNHISLALFTPNDRIEIGKFCAIAQDVVIFGGGNHIMTRATTFPFQWLSTDTTPEERYADAANIEKTTIGHDVWIGQAATVLSGVNIGTGAVIGARAVVAKDVLPYAIAVGNPAKVIRYRFQAETIKRLLSTAWWNWPATKIAANLELLYANPDEWPPDIQFNAANGETLNLIDMPVGWQSSEATNQG